MPVPDWCAGPVSGSDGAAILPSDLPRLRPARAFGRGAEQAGVFHRPTRTIAGQKGLARRALHSPQAAALV